MQDKFINVDGISFNADFICTTFSKQKDWLKYCQANPHWFEKDSNRIDKLKNVYRIATGKTEADNDDAGTA